MTSEIGPRAHFPESYPSDVEKARVKNDLEELQESIIRTFKDLPDHPRENSIKKLQKKLISLNTAINTLPVSGTHGDVLHTIATIFNEYREKEYFLPLFSSPKEPTLQTLPEKIHHYDKLLNNIQILKKAKSNSELYQLEYQTYLEDPMPTFEEWDRGAEGGDITPPSPKDITSLVDQIPTYLSCIDECRRLLASLTSLPEKEKTALETLLTTFTSETLPYLLEQRDSPS